jgi:hypothetical protein
MRLKGRRRDFGGRIDHFRELFTQPSLASLGGEREIPNRNFNLASWFLIRGHKAAPV